MPAQPVTLTLTVSGPGGGPDTDTVTVTPLPDTITPGRVEFRTQRGQWRIEGTVSGALPDRVTARLLAAAGGPGDRHRRGRHHAGVRPAP